jgi:hypothetical protein
MAPGCRRQVPPSPDEFLSMRMCEIFVAVFLALEVRQRPLATTAVLMWGAVIMRC